MGVADTLKRKTLASLRRVFASQAQLDDLAFLAGQTAARQVRSMSALQNLYDAEFRVSSQWGEDGMIEWLVHQLDSIPETFIEFGVENYRESNTRFLLQHRNWRGLVIDGNQENVAFIRQDRISWRHDLSAIASFITRENINSLITDADFRGEIGVLSIDIDGVDYWVWEAIDCVQPHIIVAEYNSAFGDLLPLTVPYAPDFIRSRAHFSNLYYGLSIRAAEHLARKRGYTLVGTTRIGSNAFFVRNDRAGELLGRLNVVEDRPSRFRESLGINGELTFTAPARRASVLSDLSVVDVSKNVQLPLDQAGQLFSPRWQALLNGKKAAP